MGLGADWTLQKEDSKLEDRAKQTTQNETDWNNTGEETNKKKNIVSSAKSTGI